ncbi:MAG: WYL domain-containing protein [Hyphomicrobiales bacterium]
MGILDEIRNRFTGQDSFERIEPTGFAPRADARDDSGDMMLAGEPEAEPLLDGLTVGLTYEDMDGNVSERLVNAIRLVQAPDGRYLWAYCHLRKDFRAFQFDRIQQIRDYRTGAHTEDAAAFFAPYLTVTVEDEAPHTDFESRATREVLGLIGDELRILAFVAMADRHFDEREEVLVSDFIRVRAGQLGQDVVENYDHDKVIQWVRAQRPSFESLERAVERLSRLGAWELRALWDLSNDIVKADDKVDYEELRAMDDLYTAIDRAISRQRGDG